MDRYDLDTKVLRRAEGVIRTVLANKAGTDVKTVLPLLGFSNAADALAAADTFGAEAQRVTSPARRAAIKAARNALANIPAPALAAFEREMLGG